MISLENMVRSAAQTYKWNAAKPSGSDQIKIKKERFNGYILKEKREIACLSLFSTVDYLKSHLDEQKEMNAREIQRQK